MKIISHKNFDKNYRKRIYHNGSLDRQFKRRLASFLEDPRNPTLRDHGLLGKLKNRRSFSVSGDIRLVYRKTKNAVILYDIGTHNQVYYLLKNYSPPEADYSNIR